MGLNLCSDSSDQFSIMDVSYHHSDFDAEEWIRQASTLSSSSVNLVEESESSYCDGEFEHWNEFYTKHTNGTFFKPRRYISKAFELFFNGASRGSEGDNLKTPIIVEVGCGHGCSMFPLLEEFPTLIYYPTDYSVGALQILESNSKFSCHGNRVRPFEWDIISNTPVSIIEKLRDDIHKFPNCSMAVLCVFTLSAIHPNNHVNSLRNIAHLMRESTAKNPVLLFRDYGIHDMTMYRHRIRHGEYFYRRSDSTIAYYFDKEYLLQIASAAGFAPLEIAFATVCVENRKKETKMKRVFLHAIFKLSDS